MTSSPPTSHDVVTLDGGRLTIDEIERVARRGASVRLGGTAASRVRTSRQRVEAVLPSERVLYGINTGFGSLSRERIPHRELRALQHNLVRSHAAGVGRALPESLVRATMLILAASLCRGYSGVRFELVERLVTLLNGRVTPIVPSIGSVGASGDLAPLAHIALVLIGEGRATRDGKAADATQVHAELSITPLQLEAKEGLALVNGTHLMAADAALLCADAERLFDAALIANAMSNDAAKATDAFLDPRVYEVRAQAGPSAIAASLRSCLEGSTIVESHRTNDPRVQDPYSFRCSPLVLGAALDAFLYVRSRVRDELAAVTDNPLVFPDDGVVSAGSFHGMPVALPLDVMGLLLTHVAGIAQQRVFALLAARDPESGLVPHLSPKPGLCSGLMLAQYTAAACCNELVGLAAPATVANLQTSAGIEDYNSFGPRAGAKARRALELTRWVVAIELLCAAQALELHRPLRSGEAVERAWQAVRTVVSPLTTDRPLGTDIEALARLVEEDVFALGEASPLRSGT
ncbi:MAG: histidine ammonia-lyase [Luteitalea sp.]|nr:histidine ammonia-lyase [Luteitalea sp.]